MVTVTNTSELLAALAAAMDGDTIELAPGAYEGSFPIVSSNVTLVGSGTEETWLRGQLVPADDVRGLLFQDLSYDATVFSLDGAGTDSTVAGVDSAGWTTDRAALGSLSVVTDPVDASNNVLAFTTNGAGETTGFRAYQGVKYLPGSGEQWAVDLGNGGAVESRFYIDPQFAHDGHAQTSGLWVQMQNADNSINGAGWFAALEYVDADRATTLGATATDGTQFTGGFRIWLDDGPDENGGHDGSGDWVAYVNHSGDGWVDLAIAASPGAAAINFNVDGQTVYTATDGGAVWGADGFDVSKIDTVIVQSHNGSGEDTDYLYDDITLRADTSGRDVYGDGWTLDFTGGQWVVSNAESSVVLDGVDKVQVDGVVYVLVDQAGDGFASIQAAIDAADQGDTVLIAPGTYAESLSLNKCVQVTGLHEVMVQGGGTGNGLAIGSAASGDAGEPLVVSNITISGFAHGLVLQNVSDLTLQAITASGNAVGVKVPSAASVDHLTVIDSHFDGNTVGWYSDLSTAGDSNISDVLFSNTSFDDNAQKGFYTEKLSDAVFDHVTVNGSGFDPDYQYNSGFDINLKYGDYANITIKDSTFIGSGIDGTGPGIGIKIEARGYEGDSVSYTANPATLDGLTIEHVTVSGGGANGAVIDNVSNLTTSGNDINGLSIDGERTPATFVVDASGNGDFTSLQAAIDVALDGDAIVVRAGTYEGGVTVDKGVTIVGEEGAVLQGSFLEDNHIPPGTNVDEWLQSVSAYSGASGAGIVIASSDVTIQGLQIESFYQGVRFAGGPETLSGIVLDGLDISNVIAGIANTYGQGSTTTSRIDGIDILNLSISHGYDGLQIQDPANQGGLFAGLTLDGASFQDLLEKGIYAELLSNSTLRNIEMNNVGQFGRADPMGEVGQSGNGIDLNLKWGEFSGIVIENFEFTDVGLSSGAGSPHAGGGAIVIKAREDGAYASDPASYTGEIIVRNGEINGTSSGIRVGEPGVEGLSGVDVQVENVSVTDHLTSADFGAIENGTDATVTVTDSDTGIDTGASTQNVHLDGSADNDVLTAGRGDDTLTGGAGDDILVGGAGTDTSTFSGNRADYTVTFNQADGSYTVRGPEGTDHLIGIEFIRFGGAEGETVAIESLRGPVTWTVGEDGDFATVAEALQSCSDGDTIVLSAGEHAGGFTISIGVSIVGEPGASIVGAGGTGITIAASNVSISGIAISGFTTGIGLAETAQTLTNLTFDNLDISNVDTGIAGLNASGGVNNSSARVDGLAMLDVDISNADVGISFDIDTAGDAVFRDITIDGGDFSDIATKGIYVEALSDSVIRDITMTNVGQNAGEGLPGNGIDVNLKYGTYANILIEDFVFTQVGGTSVATDAAISIKARDDGSYAANPGVYEGELIIRNGTIDGTGTGVQLGEPSKNNAGPDVAVDGVHVSNYLTTGGFGAYNNLSEGSLSVEGSGSVIDTGADSNDVQILGGASNDALTGTRGDDTLQGEAGNDVLRGGDGDDSLNGGVGNDTLEGGPGNDSLDGGEGIDVLRGGEGNDALIGSFGGDTLEGGAGIDTLDGGEGIDVLRGGAGDDSFTGGAGDDTIDGGDDQDTAHFGGNLADYSIEFHGASVTVTHKGGGADGVDTLTGVETLQFASGSLDLTAGIRVFDVDGEIKALYDDLEQALTLAQDGDVIELRAGEYALTLDEDFDGHIGASITLRGPNAGLAGESAIRGGEALIQITGDALEVAAANVTIDGISLSGSIVASSSEADGFTLQNSVINSGANTSVHLVGVDAAVVAGNSFTGATGIDAQSFGDLSVSSNHFATTTTGVRLEAGESAENARIAGNIFEGGQFGVSLAGDTAAYGNATGITVSDNTFLGQGTAGVHADSALPAALDASLGTSLPLNSYGTTATNGPHQSIDVIFASTADDLLVGGAGEDTIDGTGGNDIMRGGGGDDRMTGGIGDDSLYGGAGNDIAVFSGSQSDYAFSRDTSGAIVVTANGSVVDGVDRLFGVERLYFSGEDRYVDITSLQIEAVDIQVDPGQGGEGLQDALDALVLDGDSVTLGQGDYQGTQAAISKDASIELDGAQNMSLQVTGDAGRTQLTLSGDGTLDVSGSSAGMILDASGFAGSATFTGGDGNDVLIGGSGDETYVLSHGGGQNIVDGGDGDNTITLTSAVDGVIVDLDAGTSLSSDFADAWAGDDAELRDQLNPYLGDAYGLEYHASETDSDSSALLFGVTGVVGSKYDDLLIGSEAGNVLNGVGGNDNIIGKGGADVATFAGNATDYVITRADSDAGSLNLNLAAWLIGKGMEEDGFDLNLPIFRVVYVGNDPMLATDSLVQVETLRFTGSGEVNYTIGEDADGYFLQLADGGTTYAAGTDVVGDDNYVKGGDGADHMSGGDTADKFLGGAGDDVLTGGLGEDHLDGGEGSDIYEISPELENDDGEVIGAGIQAGDIVADTGATGTDRIELTGGGALDLSVAAISGVENLQFSELGNEMTATGAQLDGMTVTGGSLNDTLIVALTSGNDVALSVSEVENVRLRSNGASVVDVSAIADTDLQLETGSLNDSVTLNGVSLDVDAGAYVGELTIALGDADDNALGIETGSGAIHISGAASDDIVSVDATNVAITSAVTLSGASTFVVTALGGSIDASGATGAVTVTGAGAGQQITGGSGADILTGGTGDNRIDGDAGADFLDGNSGSDLLFGGQGDDLLYGGSDQATDYLLGGDGTDYAIFVGSRTDYTMELVTTSMDGQPDVSVVKITNIANQSFDYVETSADWLIFTDDVAGYRADDTSYNDKVAVSSIQPVTVHVFDGSGAAAGSFSTLAEAIEAAQAGYSIEIDDGTDLTNEGVVSVATDGLTITGDAGVQIAGLQLGEGVTSLHLGGAFSTEILGNELDNVITGNDGDNTIHAGAGNDHIDLSEASGTNFVDGGVGDDKIVGGAGDDVLMGGSGADLIVSAVGADTMIGGAGNDDLVLGSGAGEHVVVQGGSGNDRFIVDSLGGEATLNLDAVISDFRHGQDQLDLSHLQTSSGGQLTRGDLGLVASIDAQIDLGGFQSVGGAADGSLTLGMINGLRLTNSDFVFDPLQAYGWQDALLQ